MNAIAHREQKEVATELAGIWQSASKEEALTQLAAFKGTYHLRYPEAIRSLSEYDVCQRYRSRKSKTLSAIDREATS